MEQTRASYLNIGHFDSIKSWKEKFEQSINLAIDKEEKENRLIRLLIEIQDFYLPEIRSNLRYGEVRDYHGAATDEGPIFCTSKTLLLSSITVWQNNLKKNNRFKPHEIIKKHDFTVDQLIKWTKKLYLLIKNIDPIHSWRLLIKYVNFNEKKKLQYDALIANDFYEIASIIMLLLNDLGENLSKKGISEINDWFDWRGQADFPPKMKYWVSAVVRQLYKICIHCIMAGTVSAQERLQDPGGHLL